MKWNLMMVLIFFAGSYTTTYTSGEDNPTPTTVAIEVTAVETPLYLGEPVLDEESLQCLYENVFYEAGVSTYEDKIAVVQVTFNRFNHENRWKVTSICQIVHWKSAFSWTLIPEHRRAPTRGLLWEQAKSAVHDYLEGRTIPELEDSLFYHATWMKTKPRWADDRYKLAVVGAHVHYSTDRKL